MPDLERQIEDLGHRAHAARIAPGARSAGGAWRVGWGGRRAKALLASAVQRAGAGGGKAQTLAELGVRDPQLRRS
jgi:hypothetical protein